MIVLMISFTNIRAEIIDTAITIDAINIQNIDCTGSDNGTINLTVTGSNLTYNWSNGAITKDISNLSAGQYFVTITTNNQNTDTLYFEDFDGNVTWNINVPTGNNGNDHNFWEIDDTEAGILPPGCGSANNGDSTLHVTSFFFPNNGALYDAGGLCIIGHCVETNMRAVSNSISTINKSNIEVSFDYIGNGQGMLDNASFQYSIDAGATWITQVASLKTASCPSTQGVWTATSFLLPSNAENIPNLKVAFHWTNNDDGQGTDPSFAVNNLLLKTSGISGNYVLVDSFFITEPTVLISSITTTPISCYNVNDGAFSVAVNGGTPNYQFNWGNGSSNPTITNLQEGLYLLTITDANNCTLLDSAILTNPAQIIDTIQANICQGESLFGYDNSGVYRDTLVGSICDSVRVLELIVSSLPDTPTVFLTTDSLLISSAASSYQWYYNGIIINNANQQIYKPIENGVYQVEITNDNGCTAISNHYQFEKQTIDTLKIQCLVYPNPTDNLLNIDIVTEIEATNVSIFLFDDLGRIIRPLIYNQDGKHIESLSTIGDLAAGVYILTIVIDEKVKHLKIIVL